MNTQSTGTVTLASANHSAAPSIDPKFLSHPFDCRLAIESLRGALEFLDLECLKKDEVRLAAGPVERGDSEILVCRFCLALHPYSSNGNEECEAKSPMR